MAFFAFLAIFPAIIAAITLYGLIADPADVARQIESLSGMLPQETQPLIADQLNSVVQSSGGALGFSLIVSLLAALWSASSGTGNLIQAVNLAYDEKESRGFLKVKGTALALTLGAIVFVLITLTLVAVVPPVLDALQLGLVGTIIAQVVRWALLVGPGGRRARRGLPGRPGPRRTALSLGQHRRAGRRRRCGSSAVSCSACTSTTSAATTRPTARWPASSC